MVLPGPMVNLLGVLGENITRTLVVRRGDGKPLELTRVEVTDPSVQVAQVKVTAENADPEGAPYGARPGDIRLTFTAPVANQVGSRSGNVKFSTNHPEKPELTLPMAINIQPVVRVTPSRVGLRWQIGAAATPVRANLAHGVSRSFRATGVELTGDLPSCTARIASDKAAAVQVVEIAASGEPPEPGVYNGAAKVKTDVPGAAELEIPVTLRVFAPGAAPVAPRSGVGGRLGTPAAGAPAPAPPPATGQTAPPTPPAPSAK